MKRQIKYETLVGLPFLLLAIGLFIFFQTKEIKDFLPTSKVTRIVITEGDTGRSTTLDDQTDIKKVLSYMEQMNFRRRLHFARESYSYQITFYDNNQPLTTIRFLEKLVDINGFHYSINNSNKRTLKQLVKGFLP